MPVNGFQCKFNSLIQVETIGNICRLLLTGENWQKTWMTFMKEPTFRYLQLVFYKEPALRLDRHYFQKLNSYSKDTGQSSIKSSANQKPRKIYKNLLKEFEDLIGFSNPRNKKVTREKQKVVKLVWVREADHQRVEEVGVGVVVELHQDKGRDPDPDHSAWCKVTVNKKSCMRKWEQEKDQGQDRRKDRDQDQDRGKRKKERKANLHKDLGRNLLEDLWETKSDKYNSV